MDSWSNFFLFSIAIFQHVTDADLDPSSMRQLREARDVLEKDVLFTGVNINATLSAAPLYLIFRVT